MDNIKITKDDEIATVALTRGKVNALNESLVDQMQEIFNNLEGDNSIKSIILTGREKFFSFGFDIPELLDYSKEDTRRFLIKFTNLYTRLFQFPKPIVAAINGHAIAGGCMIATTADYRIMVTGKAKISLNEVTFGASVFAGSVDILKYCVGQRNAERILCTGVMYSAEQAHQMDLIDRVTSPEDLMAEAGEIAAAFAGVDPVAFTSIKGLLRTPVAEAMKDRELKSIEEFIDIWFSEQTRQNLREIKIHS